MRSATRWRPVLDIDEAVIDGEVILADEIGRPQFYELLRVPRSACYAAFDILWADGTDLRSLPLDERRRRLEGILPKGSPIVSEALSVAGRGREIKPWALSFAAATAS
jgi:bifunctional non-homologous end joining protein LigD